MATRFQQKTPDLLRRMETKLRSCNPKQHQINYVFDTWERVFSQDEDLFEINRRVGESISRGEVFDFAIEAQADPTCVRRLAMAVMIWGYGKTGYGPTRTSKMLGHPQAVERLIEGAEIVREGDLTDASLFFRSSSRGALNQFGWSFFTKYFYFVGAVSGLSPMPLILDGSSRDQGVAGGMKRLADAGDAGAARAMELWWSTADRRCADGYALYVELVNRWALDLECRPDAIEMALWEDLVL